MSVAHDFIKLMSRFRYIAIEGLIGAGKSTLAERISQFCNASLLQEDLDKEGMLQNFYSFPAVYTNTAEHFFMKQRVEQIHTWTKENSYKKIVADFTFDKGAVFASVNLHAREWPAFYQAFLKYKKDLPEPDVILWIDCPPELAMENIRRRSRAFEGISIGYLRALEEAYHQYLLSPHRKKVIEISPNDNFWQDAELEEMLKNAGIFF